MTDTQKRFLRFFMAVAGIMMTFTAVPVGVVEWVQNIGGWIFILAPAIYSNSDGIFPKKMETKQ